MYRPHDIEPKWQKKWDDEKLYKADENSDKQKFFVLDMFPYPSGAGLHVGHVEGYTASDIYSRYKRMKGFNILHPMGWDAFGLPAENYAIKQKVHPQVTTDASIINFRNQIKKTGLGYDWDRELNTSSPEYYKWTQWFFLLMYRNGLAYKKKAPVNWCESCQTVLANEQVIKDEKERNVCERCGNEVIQKDLHQWFFKMTAYADRMLEDLQKIEWPEKTKMAQTNWIGKQTGFNISWKIKLGVGAGVGAGRDATKHSLGGKAFNGDVDGDVDLETMSEGQACIATFTKYPETIFGATFLTLAPEHELVMELTTKEQLKAVTAYLDKAKHKTSVERAGADKEKSGVFTGSYVINPVTDEEIPVWVADYVLPNYGTGAVFGCPAHDERDLEFAKKYGIPVKRVIKTKKADGSWDDAPVTQISQVSTDGVMIHSGVLNGLDAQSEAKEKIMDHLEKNGFGQREIFYNLRDWLVSRQRYWGPPIPVVYCPHCAHFENEGECCGGDCGCDHEAHSHEEHDHECACGGSCGDDACECGGECDGDCCCDQEDFLDIVELDGKEYAIVPLPEDQLPVVLPTDVDFKPTGESPLARSNSFKENVVCPRCGAKEGVIREVDTLDTFVDSSWYYFRFCDSKNTEEFANKEKLSKWMPIDLYVGGDHATTHLLFSRFFTKVLYDLGYIDFDEPFKKLSFIGLIHGEDGRKMSKRWGNVINPDDVIAAYGADTLRTYEMFMGPLEAGKAWSTSGVEGVKRFYNRVWELSNFVIDEDINHSSEEAWRQINKLVKKAGDDIEALKFNTVVAAFMEYSNFWSANKGSVGKDSLNLFVRVVAPYAPHMAEELWQKLGYNKSGNDSVHKAQWPEYDDKALVENVMTVVVQINGKVKARVEIDANIAESVEKVKEIIMNAEKVREIVNGKTIANFVYVAGKIANIVLK